MTGGAFAGAELVFPAIFDDLLPALRALEERPNSGHAPVFAKIEALLVALVRQLKLFRCEVFPPRAVGPFATGTSPVVFR